MFGNYINGTEDIDMRAIKKYKDSETILATYVTVGDTINGHAITEIWATSHGSPRFVIGGEQYTATDHYSFEDLVALAPAGGKIDG